MAAPTQSVRSYTDKYRLLPDPLGRSYAALYDDYDTTSGTTSVDLRDEFVASSEIAPKVLLYASTTPTGELFIGSLFRVTQYTPHPTEPAEWDQHAYAFSSDVEDGDFLDCVQFPENAFQRTTHQIVPTLAGMEGHWAAHPEVDILPVLAEGAADTKNLNTRFMVRVPPCPVS